MKFLLYFIIIISLLSSLPIYAQFDISGNITDFSRKKALIGATIYLPNLKIGAKTDLKGNFIIQNLKKGTYILEISYTGYSTITRSINLQGDTTLHLILRPTVTELGEVIVTGVSHATELKRNPIVISTIDKSLLVENSSTNIIDALKEVPGMSQITTGASIAKPIIRGLGYNRIITLNNGIRQEGQQWGDEHGIEIDEFSIDRVEIIKGPGSLLYGSDGIAGVVNFLAPKPLIDETINTSILTNYQSNNNLISYSISNEGNIDNFQWVARFSNKYAGNYQNRYDGKLYNSGFSEYNGNLSLSLIKDWGYSNLAFNSYNTKLGIIEGERDDDGNFVFENSDGNEISASDSDLSGYNIGLPYQWVNHLSIASNNLLILDEGSINLDVGFQNNKRSEFEEVETPDEAGLAMSLSTLNYNIRYNFDKLLSWETSIGISGMFQINKNLGEEFLIPDYSLFDIGAFVYTQKRFDDFTIAGGIRFDNRNLNTEELYLNQDGVPTKIPDENSELKFTHFIKNYGGLSGSIGLSYQSSENSTLKLNFSNGFRAPSIAELSSNGKHEGTFRYEVGNSNLVPEFSHQIDLAYLINSEHITFEISPFINFIDNYTFLEKMKDDDGNDVYIDSDDPSPAFEYVSGKAQLWGGEIFLDIHPHPFDWLHIENSFSFVNATQNQQSDSTKYLPFIPAPLYRLGIKAQFSDINHIISNIYLKFGLEYNFEQNNIYSAYDTESSTPSYALLSAGVGLSLNVFEKKDMINLYLVGENLADIAYQNHLSRLKYAPINPATGRIGVYNMGRNISLKMLVNI